MATIWLFFSSKSNYNIFFRESYPYHHLALKNELFSQIYSLKWIKLSNKTQPVSSFFFLIMWMAVLLNSADFSRSCISSSCSNRKNMINNYFTILCKKMSISLNISSNFLGTSLDPRPPFGPKTPEIPTQKLPKQLFFYKKGNKIVKSCSMNWSIKRWIVENGVAVILPVHYSMKFCYHRK